MTRKLYIMKKQLKAAELRIYNANNRGKDTGDCVKRSISLAFDISYTEASKLLNAKMHELRKKFWNIQSVFGAVIEELGGGSSTKLSDPITVEDFVDTEVSNNEIYIMLVGKKLGDTSHMVCIREGQIWDSWDCREYIVTSYWKINGSGRKSLNNISKEYMLDLGREHAEPTVVNEIERYSSKNKWDIIRYDVKVRASSYKISVYVSLVLDKDSIITKTRTYKFEVPLIFEPTWSEEEIIAFIHKIGKQRTYDRLWAIKEQEKKLTEGYEIARQVGIEDYQGRPNQWYNGLEERFLKSLPGWVQPLITYLSVQRPGEYSSSYELRIKPHPQDPNHKDEKYLEFEGWLADDIHAELDRYKEKWEAPFIDYDLHAWL